MILDAQNEYSNAQTLTATAASANVIDHGGAGDLGSGEAMVVVVTCGTALAGASPTLDIKLQMDTDATFASPADVIALPQISALAAGEQRVLPVPAGACTERYTRVYYTLGGASPTVTLSAHLVPASHVQDWAATADAL